MRSRPLMVEYCAGMWTNSVAGRSGLPKRRVQNWKDRSLKDDRCQRLPLKARVLSQWPLKARVRPLWSQTHLGSSRLLWLAVCPPQEGGTVPLTVPVEANGEPLVPPLCLRRSQRARGTPHHLRDYVLALADC
ncbi:hypothetical protein MRX96_013215 [Rhipicephalus microplus]